MGNAIRLLLLRFLILALCFNTAVALPLHQASHVLDAVEHAAEMQALADEGEAATGHAGHDHNAAAEAQCAWCLGYASLNTAITGPVTGLSVATVAKAPVSDPLRSAAQLPAPAGWHYSSRAPPALI